MGIRRREFLKRLGVAGGGAIIRPSSLTGLAACNVHSPTSVVAREPLYGELAPSSDCPELDIPPGFRCVRLSTGGAPSAVRPGLDVPNAFDGMGAFPLRGGNVRLIRNHELIDAANRARPLGAPAYDRRGAGGTTSLEVRIGGSGTNLTVELVDEFVSLAGTRVNCAGGVTPWGTWLSCEEDTMGPGQGFERPHGYVFEVPLEAAGPVDPVPLKAMGRFKHEAVAVDPSTGIVYQTEDAWYVRGLNNAPGAGLYRFIPDRRERLAEGGRLQILAVPGEPDYVTARGQTPGTVVPATWIDIEDPDPPGAESDAVAVFREGRAKGAAAFARLEGAFYADGGIYVVSTNGGEAGAGQVFHYRPTSESEGELTLVFESPSSSVLDGPDNICLRPGGGLILCEDGGGDQYVRGLDRDGNIVDLVRAPDRFLRQPGEFTGACFSPDGRVLFFNAQGSLDSSGSIPSATYALWGPWEEGPL